MFFPEDGETQREEAMGTYSEKAPSAGHKRKTLGEAQPARHIELWPPELEKK